MKTIILLVALLLTLTIAPLHAQSLDFSSPSLFSSNSSSSLTDNNNSNDDLYTLGSVALLAWGIDYSLRSHSSSPTLTTSTAPEMNSMVVFSLLIVAFVLYCLCKYLFPSLFSFPFPFSISFPNFEYLRWKKYQKD